MDGRPNRRNKAASSNSSGVVDGSSVISPVFTQADRAVSTL